MFNRNFSTKTVKALAAKGILHNILSFLYSRDRIQVGQEITIGDVSGTKLRRLTINLAKQGSLFQEIKWLSEKHVEHRMETCTVTRAQAIGSAEACLVSRNDPMHDSVPYLRNALPNDTDILHEYFVSPDRFGDFVAAAKAIIPGAEH